MLCINVKALNAAMLDEDDESPVDKLINRLFWPLCIFAEICGIAAVVLAVLWMDKHGGFSWTQEHVFNFHPVLATVGMIFLYGQAILIYRVLSYLPKSILKLCHFAFHLLATVVFSIALAAVIESHVWKGIPNFYSLHSWLGLGMIALYFIQLITSVGIYLLPYSSIRTREMLMPFHRWFGILAFGGVGATTLMGITQSAIYSSKECWVNRTCNEADIINWFGLSIFLYVSTVIFLVIMPHYQREDELATD